MRRWRHVTVGIGLLCSIIVVGSMGYVLLGFGVLDAFYQTVTTITSLRYHFPSRCGVMPREPGS